MRIGPRWIGPSSTESRTAAGAPRGRKADDGPIDPLHLRSERDHPAMLLSKQTMKELSRLLRRHWIVSFFLVGMTLLAVLTIRNLLAQPQDPRLTAIRQAGYPVTLSELNTYYPAVPDDQNAALVYQRAFLAELFTNNVANDLTSNVNIRRGEQLPGEICSQLAAALATHAAACQLLYSATNLSGSRYRSTCVPDT